MPVTVDNAQKFSLAICSIYDNSQVDEPAELHIANSKKVGIVTRVKFDRITGDCYAFFRLFSGTSGTS
jgi:hypothetical protein